MHHLSWISFLFVSALLTQSVTNAIEDELCDEEPDDPDVCPFRTSGELSNVALGKTAEQSTLYDHGGLPGLAIDGNNNQFFWEGRTCSHTADHDVPEETKPWLRVDLGSRHLVQSVKMYTRKDPCCAHRSHDLEVRVGNEKEEGLDHRFHRNGLCDKAPGGGYEKGKVFDFNCPHCLAGRYVSVQITRFCESCKEPTKNVLSICELEIMGIKID